MKIIAIENMEIFLTALTCLFGVKANWWKTTYANHIYSTMGNIGFEHFKLSVSYNCLKNRWSLLAYSSDFDMRLSKSDILSDEIETVVKKLLNSVRAIERSANEFSIDNYAKLDHSGDSQVKEFKDPNGNTRIDVISTTTWIGPDSEEAKGDLDAILYYAFRLAKKQNNFKGCFFDKEKETLAFDHIEVDKRNDSRWDAFCLYRRKYDLNFVFENKNLKIKLRALGSISDRDAKKMLNLLIAAAQKCCFCEEVSGEIERFC